ncbi:MAG: zeta toxin family protein [Chitinophagaceae bacterium]|nr:zeta toxin family protein [Chitinophagaceae bacterium]
MADELSLLKEKFKVSEKVIDEIFKTELLPTLKYYTPATDPIAIIIGGQPGAGKTQIIQQAKKDFNNNIVECNADGYRDFHPFAKHIKAYHENLYPDLTTDLAQGLNIRLRRECQAQKLNFALEITLRDGAAVNATIAAVKKEGFTVNLNVLAVNEHWSKLGTYERLEAQRVITGYGRIVPDDAHDTRYKALPNALKDITEKKLYDNIHIYGRTLLTKEDKILQQVVLKAVNPTNPVDAYLKERNRPFTKEECKYFKIW